MVLATCLSARYTARGSTNQEGGGGKGAGTLTMLKAPVTKADWGGGGGG